MFVIGKGFVTPCGCEVVAEESPVRWTIFVTITSPDSNSGLA